MGKPQTINGLMRHLREHCNVQIHGSYQKKQLICYGYYHGYKGYRFVKKSTNRIPYTKFEEVVSVIEYDNQLKAALYTPLMFMEMSIKNMICNESLSDMTEETFEAVYRDRMNDRPADRKLRSRRLKLRNTIYAHISNRYRDEEQMDNQMVRHFYDRGSDVPMWVIFEFMYVSDLAAFFDCLNRDVKFDILNQLHMRDEGIDTNGRLLSDILYTLKALRNAVAHNNIIFDARFKDRKISNILKGWIEKETQMQNMSLNSVADYIVVLCVLLKKIDFSMDRAMELIEAYKKATYHLQEQVPDSITEMIIQKNIAKKIQALEVYLYRKQ